MFIGFPGATVGGIWANVTRTLTADPTPFAVFTAEGSLAASTILSIGGTNKWWNYDLLAYDANANMIYGLYDAVNFRTIAIASVIGYVAGFANLLRGAGLNNTDGVSAHPYSYCGVVRG